MIEPVPCPICPSGHAQVWREWRLLDGKSYGCIIVCDSCPDKSRACTSPGTGETQSKATAEAWQKWKSIP